MVRFVIAVLPALIGMQLAAQEPARDRGFGRVTGIDGKPWVGAEVHLLHRAHNAIADPALGEHLVLQSDDKGEFRTSLLTGSVYWAWAVGPLTTDRSYRVTTLLPNSVARTPMLLTEDERHFVRRLRPQLHASWNGKETLRWRAVTSSALRMSEWLEPDADGVLTTPRWPANAVAVEAWAGDWLALNTGFPIVASVAVQQGLQWRHADTKPAAADAEAKLAAVYPLAVAERRTREITLLDAAGDAPIAAAEVRLDRMPEDVAPTHADEHGIVRAVFAEPEDPSPNLPGSWTILPPGANAEFALSAGSYRQGDPPITVRKLPPGRRLDGRLKWTADEPAVGVPLLLEGSVANGNGIWFGIAARVFRTAADGSYTIPGRTAEFSFQLTAALSPAMRVRLATGDDPAPVAPLAVVRWADSELPESLGETAFDGLVALDVRVRQADGSPPGSTRVLLKYLEGGSSAPNRPVAVDTDHRGRVRVLVPSTEHVLVHATTERGAAWQELDARQRTVELTIDARHVMRFRIVDGAGNPIPDASAHLVAPAGWGARDAMQTAVREMCLVNAFPRRSGHADANGLGELVVPVLGASLDFSITSPTGLNKRVHVQWNGPEGDGPLDIVVR